MVRLTIEKPNREAEILSFDAPAELMIGRGSECACRLDFDPMASRMHAVLIVDPPSIRIKDLNSTNGLVINGEIYGAAGSQLLIQPIELRDGDELFIGQTRFTISVFDDDLDPGPEFARIKAEQEAAAIGPKRGDPMETLPADKTEQRFAGVDMANRRAAARGREVNETVADLAAVCPEIPGYRVERFLAAGKTGNIYKARELSAGETVVLRVVSPETGFTRKLADDFRIETALLRELDHGGITELLSAGTLGHAVFYTVSEFVNGENLASYLARCPGSKLPLNLAFSLLRQMTDAVAYLHDRNIVHRDIHPGSVMLFDDGGTLQAKLTEAGLARFWAENGVIPRTFMPGETERLGYLAPEELAQLGESKPSADVFSLGSVFYRMLTGRVPYEFGDESEAVRVVEEGRIRPIEELAADLPGTMAVIAERALAADPEMRYESARELLEALDMAGL